jgi:hypothetical protein
MTLLSHLKAIQYLTLNPFQQPKSLFWLVYQQEQEQQQQQQEQQDAENPFLDPPFSRITTRRTTTRCWKPFFRSAFLADKKRRELAQGAFSGLNRVGLVGESHPRYWECAVVAAAAELPPWF